MSVCSGDRNYTRVDQTVGVWGSVCLEPVVRTTQLSHGSVKADGDYTYKMAMAVFQENFLSRNRQQARLP